MGMLNNPWFRVKIAKTVDAVTGAVSLQFEHPTLAGPSESVVNVTDGAVTEDTLVVSSPVPQIL
jgi:hypothetical protein